MTRDHRGHTAWPDAWPGLGLTFGAGLGLVVALLLSTASANPAVGLTGGAALGLIVGAVVRARSRRRPGTLNGSEKGGGSSGRGCQRGHGR